MKKITYFLLSFLFCTPLFAQIKVISNNNVGIGWMNTGQPAYNLQVGGSLGINPYPANGIQFVNYHNQSGGVWYDDPALTSDIQGSLWIGTPSKYMWAVYAKSYYVLSPGGGGYGTFSDIRLKRNIKSYTGGLEAVKKINAVTYDMTDEFIKDLPEAKRAKAMEQGKGNIGFIAQDLKEIVPSLVSQEETTGFYSVNYGGLVPVLLQAIKEQQAMIEKLQAEVEALKKK